VIETGAYNAIESYQLEKDGSTIIARNPRDCVWITDRTPFINDSLPGTNKTVANLG